MEGKDFRLAKEIKYIQHQAAKHDGRFVTIGPLVFFSTETGDAWMLDPSCQLAARLARDGDPEPIETVQTMGSISVLRCSRQTRDERYFGDRTGALGHQG